MCCPSEYYFLKTSFNIDVIIGTHISIYSLCFLYTFRLYGSVALNASIKYLTCYTTGLYGSSLNHLMFYRRENTAPMDRYSISAKLTPWHWGTSQRQGLVLISVNQNVLNSMWPSNAFWQQRSGSTLVQIKACCLTTPSITWTNVDSSSKVVCYVHLITVTS